MTSATRRPARVPSSSSREFETAGRDHRAPPQKVRDAGYEKWDVHTPYPVHGMDEAMGLPDSRLGWIVLGCGSDRPARGGI